MANSRLTRDHSNADYIPALAALPLVAEPGTVWECSRATDMVGRLVEVISGQTLGAYLKETIFTPLERARHGFLYWAKFVQIPLVTLLAGTLDR